MFHNLPGLFGVISLFKKTPLVATFSHPNSGGSFGLGGGNRLGVQHLPFSFAARAGGSQLRGQLEEGEPAKRAKHVSSRPAERGGQSFLRV